MSGAQLNASIARNAVTAPAFRDELCEELGQQLRSMPMLDLLYTINERANAEGVSAYEIIRRGYLRHQE